MLATYNRAHLIEETLVSIQNQTHTNFACLITDDNSTDDTENVVKSFIKNDKRFEYFKKPSTYPQGLSATRNFGLDLAEKRNTEFIQFFDDDDIMHPQKLELQMKPFYENPDLDLTICMYRKFHELDTIEFDFKKADNKTCEIVSKNILKSFYLNQLNLNSPGPIWKRQSLANHRFDESLYYAEEREFYLRIFLLKSISYFPVKKILFWYRKHPMAITSNLYLNPKIKIESEKRFQDGFLKLVLRQRRPPFYILKSYIQIAFKNNRSDYLSQIQNHLAKPKNFLLPKRFTLLVYILLFQLVKR
ncbi:glycosyltransferase involved in cell wall biosynthesis [Leeuwenhoekiella aestuarii]|uniref:Glycosyltransferase involved in cell wall biosynthesis n=1 Tax=Leeuwenhoekiella aestuarii TaxID=2249426 RepID=A0A4Q0NQY5_9FLAO|nr:glycosyltransferase involved in cell wall biosynthesis [Leeuwenhoekiella aestuarii]